jgi:hypothetical protein
VVQPLNTDGAEWSNTDLQQVVSEVGWPNASLKVVADTTVGSLVPTVFDAYARILHPGRNGTPHSTTSAKPVAKWHVQLASNVEVLARSTNTPDNCFFAIWEGNTVLDDIRATASTANIAGYDYLMLKGSVSRAADTLGGLSPNLWWPTDHAWCVAQHLDFPCAYIGGNRDTVADLLALTEIDSSLVRVDQIITVKYDQHLD